MNENSYADAYQVIFFSGKDVAGMSAEKLAGALTALEQMATEIKAEQKRRTPAKPAASKLPVSEIVADNMRELIEYMPTRQSAGQEIERFIAVYRLTVPKLRTLAKHWGVGVTSKMRKSEIIDTIVEVLVGGKLQSAAIARV